MVYIYKERVSNAHLDYATMFVIEQREKRENKLAEKRKEFEL